ncbi:protein-export membrane protein SecF [Candidatus Wolfebacteria bacterium GWA1_42_9]|uniref:Protein-export membrane protein SecF n=2 Tax=Candidatus Wolfeibacteriota TaxID=1752735 RepID=A0A1F8DL02_9BACT|nr:MAG: protein-export membrane protein SecF [Candidatus Wolfebacteria bacterium GWA1_42_9]
MLNIIGKKYIFLSVSGVLMLAALIGVAVFGFKLAIDFTGGTSWQVKFENQEINEGEIRDFFSSDLKVESPMVLEETSSNSFIVRLPHLSENQHQEYLTAMTGKFGKVEEMRFGSIGPTIGKQLRDRAIIATILVLLGISLYMAVSFRKVSFPIRSWKYGVVTLISLFHDVLIPAGLLAYLGYFRGIEMDANFVVALLVIAGFSVHDTIVVFDRIRENLLFRRGGNKSFAETVNESINQTLARSINTSLTLVLVLLAMFFFGPVSLKLFVLVILVGTVVGTYSSIFIASPVLTIWHGSGKNR